MKKTIFLSFVTAAMMVSCSDDEHPDYDMFSGNVTLTVEPYTFDDGDTLAIPTNAENMIPFSWDNDEAIGIFQIAPTTNNQEKQVLKNGSGNSTRSSFDGTDWSLIRGNTYAAYYPYWNMLSEITYTDVPIDMTRQMQSGNNSFAHINESYDYMYAVANVPTGDSVNFDFNHVASVLMLELTVPDAASWESVTLTNDSDDNVFITLAAMNVATGEVTPKVTSSEIKLSLSNVGTAVSQNVLTLYLAVLPTTTGDLTVTAETYGKRSYSATIASKTLVAGKAYHIAADLKQNQSTGTENGYTWIDLGLPSGLKWASMNVGATSVTDYGNYYAWGETKAYGEEDESNARNYDYSRSYTKTYYDEATYKWSSDDIGNLFYKYTADTKTALDPEDDAATQNWGGRWRMPTHVEQMELLFKCYWEWTSNYDGSGVAGYIVYSAISASSRHSLSDTHIFLPAAGYRRYGSLNYAGKCGNYWASSLVGGYSYYAREFYFDWRRRDSNGFDCRRSMGQSVRAVCDVSKD